MDPVTCAGLRFAHGAFPVVCEVDLAVREGEMFALLGTNGAGKTTVMELLLGHRRPSGGTVRLLGRDPFRNRQRLAPEIGVVLQESGCALDLTVAETLRLWLRLHRRKGVDRATGGLLADADLEHRAGLRVRRLSGGERRRLDLAVALCGEPRVLLLDEPTSGLDPQARERTWDLLRGRRREGMTILFTTHYLEEAEQTADRIAIMDRGRVALTGPADLAGSFHRIVEERLV